MESLPDLPAHHSPTTEKIRLNDRPELKMNHAGFCCLKTGTKREIPPDAINSNQSKQHTHLCSERVPAQVPSRFFLRQL